MILTFCEYCKTYITDHDPFNLKGVCESCGKLKTQPTKEKPPASYRLALIGDNTKALKKSLELRPLNEERKANYTAPLLLSCFAVLGSLLVSLF